MFNSWKSIYEKKNSPETFILYGFCYVMFYVEYIYRRHKQRLSYIIIASLEANQNDQEKYYRKIYKTWRKIHKQIRFFALCKLNN